MKNLLLAALLLSSGPALVQQATSAPFPPPVWNNAAAILQVGSSYSYGTGVLQDYDMALRYYRRAAELGNVEALYTMPWATACPPTAPRPSCGFTAPLPRATPRP